MIWPLLFESFHDPRSTHRVRFPARSSGGTLRVLTSAAQASHGSRPERNISEIVHEKECWLQLPFLAFSLRPHHALHDLTTSVCPEQCHHHRQSSRTHHDLDSFAKRQTNCCICSSFVDRFNCVLKTCECSCHLEIDFLFTKCPSAHRFLLVSLESEEVFIEILCHLSDRSPNHSRRYLLSNL